uniref:Uncharacterized protein n=1 Tax=Myotis myotis TaxID=51298 RepID=A0A7J7YE40_MYOMY|nr:hypothetical protein mMyoMyo1_011141 [Myotis myotis]
MAQEFRHGSSPPTGSRGFRQPPQPYRAFLPLPLSIVSMAPQFSSAFLQKHKELQLVDNIPRGCGLTMNLVAQSQLPALALALSASLITVTPAASGKINCFPNPEEWRIRKGKVTWNYHSLKK